MTMHHLVVVGASLAGLSTVRALRDQGFDGTLTVIGDETHPPYDRPPLSKNFLLGTADRASLALVDENRAKDAALNVDWRLGTRAVRLDPAARALTLADGSEIRADGVVIATGARARHLPGAGAPAALHGVHTLRTLDDAEALRDALAEGAPRVVVVGGGFIGAEVASSARRLGCAVTVVEAAAVPLLGILGEQMGAACAVLHADNDVQLLCGTGVAGFEGDARGQVTGVRLEDGRLLPADVVVVGIGAAPAADWLRSTPGLRFDGGAVVCDAAGATDVPNVVALGDVARWEDRVSGVPTRSEHWMNAVEQAPVAARTLLSGESSPAAPTAPYFWSDQYGSRLQFAGHARPGDVPTIVEGDLESRSFLAVYRRDGRDTAVLALSRAKSFMHQRRSLNQQLTEAQSFSTGA